MTTPSPDGLPLDAVQCPTCGALPCDQGKLPAAYAWLIEAAESEVSAPLYWAGYFGDERSHWTSDARKATWLARESDAAAVAEGVLHGYAVRVCQHAFD